MTEADVVVVGAGPAGTSAAIGCAEAGLRVVVLERAAFPREAPGETLHPGVESLLRRLGVWDAVEAAGFLRHQGNWVGWDGPLHFSPFGSDGDGPWRGLQAWRATFDALLLDRARALGVDVRQPCRVARPCIENGRVVGVATAGTTFRASFVIDATGRRHWLARRLGLAFDRRSPPLFARYGYLEGECPARDDAPAIIADRDGWTWTARVRPRLYQWTRLTLAGSPRDASPLPEDLRELSPRGPARSADVTWRIASPTAGPGYFLAGDAAAVLDPSSSHGVLSAILSGILAAHLITRVARREATPVQTAHTYDAWLRRRFLDDVEALRAFYARLPRPPVWVVAPPGS